MATKYSGTLSSGNYNLDVYIEVLQQDVANNRSLVRQTVALYKMVQSSTWHAASSSSLQVYRHGQLLANVTPAYNTQNATVVYLWAEDVWLQHADDGRLSFPLTATFAGGQGVGSVSNVGGEMTVPTIPRGSKPRIDVGYVDAGTNLTVYTDRASTTFTHTLRWQLGSASGTIANGVGAQHTWAVPLSILNNIPNSISGQLVIALDTYDAGGNYISSHTKTITLYAPVSIVPTVSGFTSSETTPGLSANVGAFVQNASKPRIQATRAGVYGSTIVATSVRVGSQTMAGADVTTPNAVPTSGAVPVVITVTDSRGRTGTLTASITVLPWQPPQVVGVAVSRRGTAAGTGAQTDSGTFVRIDLTTVVQSLVVGGTERNAAVYTLAYRAVGSTGGFTVDRTGTRVIGSSTAFMMASVQVPADASREYLLTVTDDVGTTMVMFTIASSILVHLDGSAGVGIRKRRQQGALDVLGDGFFSGLLNAAGLRIGGVDPFSLGYTEVIVTQFAPGNGQQTNLPVFEVDTANTNPKGTGMVTPQSAGVLRFLPGNYSIKAIVQGPAPTARTFLHVDRSVSAQWVLDGRLGLPTGEDTQSVTHKFRTALQTDLRWQMYRQVATATAQSTVRLCITRMGDA